MKQQSFRRLGAMAATASFALVVLAACGAGDYSELSEDVTRVPIMSDAAAQATKEAPPPGASPTAGAPAEVAAGQATPPAGAATAQTVQIVAHDIYFEPKDVTIPANTDVTVELPNQGAAPHDFSIDKLGIQVSLPPGETQKVVINAPPGTYEFYCNVPGHKEAGMVGTLTVTTAAPAAPAGTPQAAAPSAASPAAPAAPAAATPVSPPAAQAAQPVVITAHDIYFDPKEVTIPANTDVTVKLPNEGVTLHNFSIDALGISVDLPPGETKETVINAKPGTYEFYCNVPGHKEAGMVGTLTVTENAGAAPASAPQAAATPAPAAAAAGTAAAPAAQAQSVEIVSHDIYFDPKEVTIPANTDVTFVLPNEGVTLHDFSIDKLGIQVSLPPGETQKVVINAPPGTYEFYCNVPGHKEAGMVGTLTVTANGGAAAPQGAAQEAATPPQAPPAATTGTAAAETPAAAAQGAQEVEIVSHDIYFEPKDVTIPANTDVTVKLPNEGVTAHNFSIDALGISVDLAPGETKETVINAPAGTYEFYCNVPGHKEAGMVGTLTVK